jgi:hypothetical protein
MLSLFIKNIPFLTFPGNCFKLHLLKAEYGQLDLLKDGSGELCSPVMLHIQGIWV